MRRQRCIALLLCAALLCPLLCQSVSAAVLPRTFQLSQARRMALTNSPEIKKQYNQIVLKKMKYVEAVKGIQAKVKNLQTFRWTPLLSFKFQEKLNLTEEYELNIKPLTLQTEIDNLNHRLKDLEYEVSSKVEKQFFEVYMLQQETEFTQQRLTDAEMQLRRNQASLATGQAVQADVDTASKAVDSLKTALSNQLREFETAKGKLKDLTALDVSVGYRFLNPFQSVDIPRSALDSIIQYTLANDQIYYEAKATEATARLNIDSYERFMKNQYGNKMQPIQSFIDMARQGRDVDSAAFKIQYDAMLKNLDKPWAGRLRILFFTFTMEWFKGQISGTRYIEDEMYALYTACMEYANAKRDLTAAEKSLRSQVRDGFEALVTGFNTWQMLEKLATQTKSDLDRLLGLNKIGKASYVEVADQQESYQTAQIDALSALHDYNVQLSEFDRLTCGAVSKYLKSAGAGLDVGKGGDTYATLDPINEPYYYIYSSVADLTFYIGISIPDNFEPVVDGFEVWYENTQIGERTAVGEELRHLTIDYGSTNTLTLRLYNGDTYVTECDIDASVPRARLDLPVLQVQQPTQAVIGTYTVETAVQGSVNTSRLKLTLNASLDAAEYTITYGEKGVYTSERLAVKEEFSYLTLLISSLTDVKLNLYDTAGSLLATASFDSDTQEILADIPAP